MLRSFNQTFAPIPTIDINGGTIDGTTIGASVPAAGTFSTLSSSGAAITGGSVNGTTVGASSPSTGAFTTLSANNNVSFNGGTFIFNDAGADKDARFEGDNDQNLLFLDASADRVGIGTNNPSAKLEIIGFSGGAVQSTVSSYQASGYAPASLALRRRGTGGGITPDATNIGEIRWDGVDASGSYDFLAAIFVEIGTNAAGGAPSVMGFLTAASGANATERMRITNAGNVGIGTTTIPNKLQLNGSLGRTVPVTKTGNFTLADTENWVICNGSGSITVTLPAASSWSAREVTIKTIAAQTVVSASSNVVPIDGSAAGTAILAATAGKFATLVSDGTNWIIMAAN